MAYLLGVVLPFVLDLPSVFRTIDLAVGGVVAIAVGGFAAFWIVRNALWQLRYSIKISNERMRR